MSLSDKMYAAIFKFAAIGQTLCQLPEAEERLQALPGATPPLATPVPSSFGSKRDKWSQKEPNGVATEDILMPNMEGSSLSSIVFHRKNNLVKSAQGMLKTHSNSQVHFRTT